MLKRKECHDCGTLEGYLHQPGCDMERCPFCLNQLISCECVYQYLKICVDPKKPEFNRQVYEHGLSDEHEARWSELLNKKGRIPYLNVPNMCVTCGELWPDLFMAEDWEFVIPYVLRNKVLCRDCYEEIKEGYDAWSTVRCRLCGTDEGLVSRKDEPDGWVDLVPPIICEYHERKTLQDVYLCSACCVRLHDIMPNGWKHAPEFK